MNVSSNFSSCKVHISGNNRKLALVNQPDGTPTTHEMARMLGSLCSLVPAVKNVVSSNVSHLYKKYFTFVLALRPSSNVHQHSFERQKVAKKKKKGCFPVEKKVKIFLSM